MRYSEFNQEVNPNNENVYDVKTSNGLAKRLSINEAATLCNTDPNAIVYWRIPKGYFAVKITSEPVANAIKEMNSMVTIFRKGSEFTIVCRGTYAKSTINNVLACGVSAETMAHTKDGESVMLPFKNPKVNTAEELEGYEVFHSNGIKDSPLELYPLRTESGQMDEGLQFPILSNTQTIIFTHLKRLTKFGKSEQTQILKFINSRFCQTPLTDDELKTIIDALEENLMAQFMDKSEFFHDKLGNYLIDSLNVKRDSKSKELFFYDKKKNIYVNDPDYIMGHMTRLIPRLKQYQKDETKNYILNYLYEDAVEFNKNQYTVVFKNGVYDLGDGSFKPMTPDQLESIMIDANYDPQAYSATADEFFRNATCGDEDTEQLLYEVIGYSMLKTSELAKWFILTGNGRNGKSTYFDIIKTLVGSTNYASCSFKDLSNNFRASLLKGKLVSVAGDISSQAMQDTDLLKSITAYEDVTLEEKYKQATVEKLFVTMLFSCNTLPRTPDTSDGFYRRAVIVPFNADLTKISTVDGIRFKVKLLSEESIAYIAYKSLKAIEKMLNTTHEFTMPEASKKALDEYKVINSSVLSWFKDNYNNSKARLQNRNPNLTNAFTSYQIWCRDCNRQPLSKTNFIEKMRTEVGIVYGETTE